MNPAPATPPATPAVTLNYVKLTASLTAVALTAILFWHLTNHWGDFKAGFNGTALRKSSTTQSTPAP